MRNRTRDRTFFGSRPSSCCRKYQNGNDCTSSKRDGHECSQDATPTKARTNPPAFYRKKTISSSSRNPTQNLLSSLTYIYRKTKRTQAEIDRQFNQPVLPSCSFYTTHDISQLAVTITRNEVGRQSSGGATIYRGNCGSIRSSYTGSPTAAYLASKFVAAGTVGTKSEGPALALTA